MLFFGGGDIFAVIEDHYNYYNNDEIVSARGVSYIESAGESKHHFISPFKVDDPITDHVGQVQDNSLSESLTTPVSNISHLKIIYHNKLR